MGSKVVGYCVVTAILGIIAAATGFAAEATRVKMGRFLSHMAFLGISMESFVKQGRMVLSRPVLSKSSKAFDVVIVSNECVYPSSPAFALGIVSAVFTIITRIYMSVAFGGSGCCRTNPNSTPMSQLFFVFSWIASVVGVVLLFTAAGLNNRESGQGHASGYILCYVVKPGIFAAGATLALLSAIFGIAAYITLTRPSQIVTTPVAYPMGAVPPQYPLQQYPPQQYAPQQYPPQQYAPQQYVPQQFYPPQK